MGSVKLVDLTKDLVQGALDVLRESFFPDERVCTAVGILTDSEVVPVDSPYKCTKSSLELEDLCLDVLKDKMSVAAVDPETNEVLGIAFNKIQVQPPPGQLGYFEKFANERVKDPPAKALMDFMIEADSKKDIFAHYNATCALELMFLGVKRTASGRGIGQQLIEETIKRARAHKGEPAPQFVCAIYSSRFSQRAASRAGMECVIEVPYAEFRHKGRTYLEILGPEHPTIVLSGKKL